MAVDPAVQEKAHAAEHRVALVRWAVITFNTAIYIVLLDKAQAIEWLAWTIIVVAQAYALLVIFQRPYEHYPVMRSATFTSLTDMTLIVLWVLATGNWYSPFYVVWYISIVAIAFRFSFQRTLAVATLYSGAYVGVLALGGELLIDPATLGVRVGYIFLVGWLAGLIGEETYAQTREKLAMRELADELQVSESRWRSLVANAPNIIMMVDPQGTLQFVNRTVGDISLEDAVGTSVYAWVAPAHRPRMRKAIEHVFETGEPASYEVPGPGLDGEDRWYHTRVGPMEVDGEVEAALLISMDITDRRRAEEELRRSNADLEQFAYVASHDLQEPLRMVTSYVQLLARRYQGQLDAEADEFIGYAVEGSTRMQRLIQDLLAYSHVNSGELVLEPVDLQDILETVLIDMEARIQETGAEVQLRDLPTVRGDPGLLGQLFANLISNAIKFQDGGKPVVRVTATRDQDAWTVHVEDNGIGIEPGHRERIFQLFQRLHKRARYPGTGIGLSICKRIVERHGGTISMRPSRELGGSCFDLRLPVAWSHEPVEEAGEDGVEQGG